MDSKESKSKLDLSKIPRVVGGLKLSEAVLSSKEGLLFSRVDGVASLEHLVKSSGMAGEEAIQVLLGLEEKGVITWGGEAEPSPEGNEPGGRDLPEEAELWEGMSFDPFDLAEEVDLDKHTKKKILYLYGNLSEVTHYEILQVGRGADPSQIKRAYFQVSREFHPDSYFRKNLGSYARKIEALFKRASKAYEVLGNSKKRRDYDARLPPEPDAGRAGPQRFDRAQQEKDQRLRKERRQRLLKQTPIAARKKQAQQHYQDALVYQSNNELVKAGNSIKLALALEPGNQSYQKLLEQVGPRAAAIRAEREFRRGQMEESMGRYEEALGAYLCAIENNSSDARAFHRASALLLEFKKDLRQAVAFCRQAQQLEPTNAKYQSTLAEIYLALGMNKNAVRELVRYLELNPLDEQAAQKLSDLKKMK